MAGGVRCPEQCIPFPAEIVRIVRDPFCKIAFPNPAGRFISEQRLSAGVRIREEKGVPGYQWTVDLNADQIGTAAERGLPNLASRLRQCNLLQASSIERDIVDAFQGIREIDLSQIFTEQKRSFADSAQMSRKADCGQPLVGT